ncbi:hypothetical protein Taro_007313 [Colocasia esculenta]|uniref:Uncharacterized protein n=1 Tax=Colocasia esculenta TaxID=4460 RepID=A0A843TV38_COLES|nr:hypothetical protein [Colocasia esculenta]
MVSILHSCLCSSKRSMPYACQLTSLFLFIDIQIPYAEMTPLKSRSSYDLTAAQRMGYKMVDGIVSHDLKGKGPSIVVGDGEDEEDEEVEDEDEAEDQEAEDSQSEPVHAPGDGDSIAAGDTATEPSIRDLIAQLQIQMSTGFANLNERLDTVRLYSRHVPKTRFKRSRKIRKACTCRQPERSLSTDTNRPARHTLGQECLSTAAVSPVDID